MRSNAKKSSNGNRSHQCSNTNAVRRPITKEIILASQSKLTIHQKAGQTIQYKNWWYFPVWTTVTVASYILETTTHKCLLISWAGHGNQIVVNYSTFAACEQMRCKSAQSCFCGHFLFEIRIVKPNSLQNSLYSFCKIWQGSMVLHVLLMRMSLWQICNKPGINNCISKLDYCRRASLLSVVPKFQNNQIGSNKFSDTHASTARNAACFDQP